MKEPLAQIIISHLKKLGMVAPGDLLVEHPKVKSHGDYSTNVAMVLAKQEKTNPRELAIRLKESLESESDWFQKVEVAGPGFINLFLTEGAYQRALQSVWDSQQKLILPTVGKGKRVLVEFVSANPTGPIHVGHGRNAVVGDCLARLMASVGYEVVREFYVNDHGVQIQTLGRSGLHYHQVLAKVGGVTAALPEDMYRGEYIEKLVDRLRDELTPMLDEPLAVGKRLGVELLEDIKTELKNLDVEFDHYFSESSLYEEGKIDDTLELLKRSGKTFESEGALWFRTTDFGDDKDRVLIKSDNTYTYFTPDIAYHQGKFERKFDIYINVMGADHGGYVKRVKAAVQALGFESDRLEFLLMQLVSLKRGGETVSMSKRSGDYVSLNEVIQEVGKDATRFFFMLRSHNSNLEFDLELAKKETSENPVFYIQYAHARMCSIFAKATEAGWEDPEKITEADLTCLNLPEELSLIKILLTYPEVLTQASDLREPHRVAFFLMELAKIFQNYYTQGKTDAAYRVLGKDRERTRAKLYLIKTLREVFRLGLEILGVGAPERMHKEKTA